MLVGSACAPSTGDDTGVGDDTGAGSGDGGAHDTGTGDAATDGSASDDAADAGGGSGGDASSDAADGDAPDGGSGGDADAGPDADFDGGPSTCGDGVVDTFEQCDDGARNSATAADACRPDCQAARCGDGVVDSGETCDDGDRWSGDGCSATCAPETGPFEAEPNNSFAQAQAIDAGRISGSLPDRDVDCFAVYVDEPGWLRAEVDTDAGCPGDTWLRMLSPAGTQIAENDDASTSTRCSLIDPDVAAGARYLVEGEYTVCVEGFLGSAITGYTLELTTDNDACDPGRFPTTGGTDLDLDGLVDACDDDDDNDTRLDWVDNCPRVPNSGRLVPAEPAADGYIRNWIIAGPYGQSGGTACMPNTDEPAGVEADLRPEYGGWAGTGLLGTTYWRALLDNDDLLNFVDYFGGTAPRSAYALAYVHSPTTQAARLRLGSDDGVRVWVKGTQVFESGTCRGTVRDNDSVDIELQAGVTPILFKVRDNGGGWGLYARLVAPDGSALPDIRYGLAPTVDAIDAQRDSDADGIGDACDPTP